jgi:hypothetical protein
LYEQENNYRQFITQYSGPVLSHEIFNGLGLNKLETAVVEAELKISSIIFGSQRRINEILGAITNFNQSQPADAPKIKFQNITGCDEIMVIRHGPDNKDNNTLFKGHKARIEKAKAANDPSKYFLWSPEVQTEQEDQAEREQLKRLFKDVDQDSIPDDTGTSCDDEVSAPKARLSKQSTQPGPKTSGKRSKTAPVIGQPSITGFTVQQTPDEMFKKDEMVRAIAEAVIKADAERRTAEKVEEEARIAAEKVEKAARKAEEKAAKKAEKEARKAEEKAAKEARKAEEKAEQGEKHDELMSKLEEIKKKKDEIIEEKDRIIQEKDEIIAKKDEDNANLRHELRQAYGKMGAYRNEAGKETREENERLTIGYETAIADKEEFRRYNAVLNEKNAVLEKKVEHLEKRLKRLPRK